jgi:hypothetical protein
MNNEFNMWLEYWMERIKPYQMELRPLKKGIGSPVYTFYGSKDINDIARVSEENKGNNIFYGILGREVSTGGKESIKEAHCLWVDIDFKDLVDGQTEADGLIATFDHRPSLQIFTGGGYHVYWFLENSTTDLARVERILKGLVPRLRSDAKVAQVACILRPPGTINWKYNPPREVRVVSFGPDNIYTLDDFTEWEIKQEPLKSIITEVITEERINLKEYLKHYKIPIVKIKKHETAILYCLKKCLFEEGHTTNQEAENEAAIGQQNSGMLFYQCFHNSCKDKTWADAKEKISGNNPIAPFIAREIKPLIKQYVERATGQFTMGGIASWFEIKTMKERAELQDYLEELEDMRTITRIGNKHGTYRPVERNPRIMVLGGIKGEPSKVTLPLELHTIVTLFPKNVILVAGEKDAGKTCFALNAAFLNRDVIPVRYINSEMGEQELDNRIINFPDHRLHEWKKITWIEQSSKFEDVIDPYGLNIIDFLEIGKDAFEAVDDIKRVFDKLQKGLLLIVMQKRSYKEFAVGGEGTLEKARLAINLEHRAGIGNVCKITVAKNWTGKIQHPKGYECGYKIVSGGKMTIDRLGWYKPEETTEARKGPLKRKNPLEGVSGIKDDVIVEGD